MEPRNRVGEASRAGDAEEAGEILRDGDEEDVEPEEGAVGTPEEVIHRDPEVDAQARPIVAPGRSAMRSFLWLLVALLILTAAGQLLIWIGWPVVVVFGALLLYGAGAWIVSKRRDARALRRFRDEWTPRGKNLLLVYSNSPHWQQYIETTWLPRWGSRAAVLNWSDRSRWNDSSEVELFRRFAREREFNPLAIVVPKSGTPTVIRFWQAFRDNKHGRPAALRAAETKLAAVLQSLDGQ